MGYNNPLSFFFFYCPCHNLYHFVAQAYSKQAHARATRKKCIQVITTTKTTTKHTQAHRHTKYTYTYVISLELLLNKKLNRLQRELERHRLKLKNNYHLLKDRGSLSQLLYILPSPRLPHPFESYICRYMQ